MAWRAESSSASTGANIEKVALPGGVIVIKPASQEPRAKGGGGEEKKRGKKTRVGLKMGEKFG